MNGSVIQYILANNPFTSKYYKGFCTYDLDLPPTFSKPAVFILNTDRWYGAGEHWCVANFLSDDVCEFYDSYGKPPCYYNFDKILYPRVKNVVFNPHRFQGETPTCGHHCLFYVLHRYYGYSPAYILNELLSHNQKSDLPRNDAIVYNFIAKNFGEMYARFV